MFEGLPRLILYFVIAGVVWYAMRWFKALPNQSSHRRPPPRDQAPQGRAPRAAEDLVACKVCGAYVAAGAPTCGRPDCPQAR